MAAQGPAAIPTASVIPSGGTQDVSYNSRTHPQSHNDLWAEIVALWTKLGITDSPAHDSPLANTVLASLANGKTGFRQVAAGDLVDGTSTLKKIAEVSGTGSSGVLTFSSIPATYRELEISIYGRSDTAATNALVQMTAENTPTAGAYDFENLFGNTSSAGAAQNLGASDYIQVGAVPGASSTANVYSTIKVWLPEYAKTSNFKSTLSFSAGIQTLTTGNLTVSVVGGLIEQTAAISILKLALSAGNWTPDSRATLWGRPA
jgi:hypothetical protein